MKGLYILIMLLCAVVCQTVANNPVDTTLYTQRLVYIGEGDKLQYNKFANEGESNADNIIPDFSHAGYRGGGVALPVVSVRKSIKALSGDNREHIQAAIDEVGNLPLDANGFRGAVLLKAGTYKVEGSLFINKSGVVLRGEGQGMQGTIIQATQRKKHNLINLKGVGKGYGEVAATRTAIADEYVATGSQVLTVESAVGYKAGDRIVVVRTPNQSWIDALEMAQYNWTYADYKVAYERQILAVDGHRVYIDAPIVDPIQKRYGGGYICKVHTEGRISQSAVESVRLVSDYSHEEDEEHGWNGVRLGRVEDCWVKNVTVQYFGYACVSIAEQSVRNTVVECAMLDPKSRTYGGRKYSFDLAGGSFNLVQRCYARAGRHDFVTGARVAGPNVFLDCYAAESLNDSGPHHRWATGVLLDNIRGGQMRVQNRKASGTGHGWAGAQTLFWNCLSVKSDVKVDSPLGAKNWAIGTVGVRRTGAGHYESWGEEVQPRSLYLNQLRDRLGTAAVDRVTIPAQRIGYIYGLLEKWAGEGVFPVK